MLEEHWPVCMQLTRAVAKYKDRSALTLHQQKCEWSRTISRSGRLENHFFPGIHNHILHVFLEF